MPNQTPIDSHARVRGQARAEFDKWALSYDRSALNGIIFFPSIRRCLEEVTRWQSQRQGGPQPFRLLDVGCGTGTLLNLLSRDPLAERLVGLDYSPVMIRLAIEKLDARRQSAADPAQDAGAPPGFVVGDSERLPFADGTFDLVTCCNSFHHYPHQAAAVRSFCRVLRPGGRLILIDGFRDNLLGWMIFDVGVTLIEGHVHHAGWKELRGMMAGVGFREIIQRKLNVFAPLLVSIGVK